MSVTAGNWTLPVALSGIGTGAANETQTLTVSAVSGNTAAAQVASVSYSSPAATGTLNLIKASNQATGNSVITVTVSDGVTTTTRSFTIYVRSSLNANPTISGSGLSGKTIAENTSTAAIPFTVGDDATAAASLTLAGRSSNPALVPDSGIVFGGSASNRTVTVTPLAQQIGTATIYLFVSDSASGMATTNFSLTVTQANTAPTISGATLSGSVTNSGLTASQAVFTDASKALSSTGACVI